MVDIEPKITLQPLTVVRLISSMGHPPSSSTELDLGSLLGAGKRT